MAEEKNIDTRICLKYDLLSAWEKDGADLGLKPGEAVVAFDSDTDTHRMKIGDGKRTFKELPWANGVMPGIGEKAEVFNGIEPDHASGESSHAEGVDSFATGKGAHAEGADTYAEAKYSHAEGVGTIAAGYHQGVSAEGTYNDTAPYSDTDFAIKTVGNGYWDDSAQKLKRSNALIVRNSGLIEGGMSGEEFSNKINAGGVNEKVLTPVGWVNTRLQSLISQISEKTGAEEVNRLIEEYISDLSSSNIVEMHPTPPDGVLTLANNTLYIVQCYDSNGDLADMELIKSNGDRITTEFAVVLTASDFQAWPLNELVLYQASVMQGYVKSTNSIVAIAPTTTNHLLYWTISGSIFNVGSGITVEANPSASAQTPLTKLRVDNTVYSIPQGGGGTEVEAKTDAQDWGMELSGIKIGEQNYNVFSSHNVNYEPGNPAPVEREEELTSITCGAFEHPTGRFTITQFYRHNITLVAADEGGLSAGAASVVALFNLVTTSPEPFTTLEEVGMEIYAQTNEGQGYISATGSMRINQYGDCQFINYLQSPNEDGTIIRTGQLESQVSDGSFSIDAITFMDMMVLLEISDIVQRT